MSQNGQTHLKNRTANAISSGSNIGYQPSQQLCLKLTIETIEQGMK